MFPRNEKEACGERRHGISFSTFVQLPPFAFLKCITAAFFILTKESTTYFRAAGTLAGYYATFSFCFDYPHLFHFYSFRFFIY